MMVAPAIMIATQSLVSSADPPPLPRLGASPSLVSVGGISSGADLAVGYMTAHSASTLGAAIWAGNVYRCYVTRFAHDSLVPCTSVAAGASTAGCINVDPRQAPCDPSIRGCPHGLGLPVSKCQGCAGPDSAQWITAVNVSELLDVARQRGAEGKIDAPDQHLRGRRIFLYRGSADQCYKVGSVDHAWSFFQSFGADVRFVNSTVPSLHSIPTVSTGTPCGTKGSYTEKAPHGLEACGYDGAGAALAHIYGPLKPAGAFAPDRLLAFDQREFDGPEVGLDDKGWLYVPEECAPALSLGEARKAGSCAVHVFLHGCGMAAASGPSLYAFNDTYARRAGFNEHAATNRIVVVYPQLRFGQRARGSAQADGCWDQSGQSGDEYSDKRGAQIAAIQSMVRRLLEPPVRVEPSDQAKGRASEASTLQRAADDSGQSAASARAANATVLSPADARAAERTVRSLVDWIMRLDVGSGTVKGYDHGRNPLNHSIFINGNLARVLLGWSRLGGNATHREEGLHWCDSLVREQVQMPTAVRPDLTGGYWGVGYPTNRPLRDGDLYLGDTGSAVTTLVQCVWESHDDDARREAYLGALRRYDYFVRDGCPYK